MPLAAKDQQLNVGFRLMQRGLSPSLTKGGKGVFCHTHRFRCCLEEHKEGAGAAPAALPTHFGKAKAGRKPTNPYRSFP